MTESELRSLAAQSREEGYRVLLLQYGRYVYKIVWNYISGIGTPEDAEEIVSDVFAEVFTHFEEIRPGSLQGYISTVAGRMAIDAFRRMSARGKPLSIEDVPEQISETDVAGEHEASVLRQVLLDNIQALGEPDATIIIQKYYYDRNAKEIAEAVHLRPAAVRMRLNRAMKRLRKLLEEEGWKQ